MHVDSRRTRRSPSPIALVALLALALPCAAQERVEYELLSGSKIIDACVECERATVERPLRGTLTLELLPSLVCCIWEVSAIDLTDPSGDYTVRGDGSYGTSTIGEPSQSATLELEVAGDRGVILHSGDAPLDAPGPVVVITVTEDGTRDPLHRYTIELIAAPSKSEPVRYELEPADDTFESGSYLEIICPNCELIEPRMPIEGTFELARVGHSANPIETYTVDAVRFTAISDIWDLEVGGGGWYEYGGEVAITHRMVLHTSLSSGDPAAGTVVLDSGRLQPTSRLPEIVVDVDEGELHLDLNYRLHIVARPGGSTEMPFRRGDVDDDAHLDISDAVRVFLWLFAGASPPGCLAAADVNADGGHDLSDGVYLLSYLFQGGDAPPSPGPTTCGPGDDDAPPCAAYTSCRP